jgi:hypothetical protein
MNRRLFLASGLFLLLAALGSLAARPAVLPRAVPAGEESGRRILAAAGDLFQALGEKQRAQALFDPQSDERYNWHFIPRDRKGVPRKELEPAQQSKLLDLLKASLSEEGFRKAEGVMAHEKILGEMEGPKRQFPRDPSLYFLSFFGKPSSSARWGYRVEGHHLSINFSLDGGRVLSATPLFYGANPSIVREGPKKGFRLLAGVEDLARDLVRSLKGEPLEACLATAGGQVPEEVPGATQARYTGPFPRGVSGERLPEADREKLRRLVEEYTRNLPPDLVEAIKMDSMKDIHLAWQGSLEPYQPHSYLIHGPGFMINYTNRQNGAAHVHSCLRNLNGEFGLSPASQAKEE